MDTVLIIESGTNNLVQIRRQVKEWALSLGAAPDAVEGLILAVDESATNIMTHGYQGGPGLVEIHLTRDDQDLIVTILDQAPLFDPSLLPPPDLTLPLELRTVGGLGVFLARNSVDEYSYQVTPEGHNQLTLRVHISKQMPE